MTLIINQQVYAITLDDLANIKEEYTKKEKEIREKELNRINESQKQRKEFEKQCRGIDPVSQMALQGRYISAFNECIKNTSNKECIDKINNRNSSIF